MKIVFLGSGAFGLPTLQKLHAEHEIAMVITQPDRPAGRKMKLTPTDVGRWAAEQGLPVLKTDNANTPEHVTSIAGLSPDASVVIAFGQKLSPELIAAGGELVINLHSSLLPKYRGAAPIARAVMAGESHAGVSVIALAQRMDAGEVYATDQLVIGQDETAGDLHDRLAVLGPGVVLRVLEQLTTNTLEAIEQDETLATRAPKFTKAEGSVSFDAPADAVRARINGLNPWPGCTVLCQPTDGSEAAPVKIRRVRVLPPEEAACADDQGSGATMPEASTSKGGEPGQIVEGLCVQTADGLIQLIELQAAGTKVMSAEAFAAGRNLKAGDWLLPLPGFVQA